MKDNKASERLGDLAQVLPKGGRSLMILVGEKEVSLAYEFKGNY
jgi:ribosome recycling factor